jgi:fatty-acyl-CoA synthase
MQPSQCRVWPKYLPQRLTYPRTSLYFNLEVSARRYPDKPSLIYYDSALTFAQIKDEVDALAGFLQQRCGVQRGDRVLLFMQNSPQFIIAFYAILRADAMVVPINTMNLTEEVRHYVVDSDAAVAITGQELYAQIRPLIGEGLRHVIVAAYADQSARRGAGPASAHRRRRHDAVDRRAGKAHDAGRRDGRPRRLVRNALYLRHHR